MAGKITCPHCSATLRSETDLTGRRVKCQKCSQKFLVGAGAAGTNPSETQEMPPAVSTMEMAALDDAEIENAVQRKSGIQTAVPHSPSNGVAAGNPRSRNSRVVP